MTTNDRIRVLIFSHDSFGLGHFRRCQLIAAGITAHNPGADCLIITGSPRAQSYALPDRVDCVKLPAATKGSDGAYRSRKLDLSIGELVDLRSQIALATAASYRPDLILVDHAPVGIAGELAPLLGYAEMTDTKLVLGVRDIIDRADLVERSWNDSDMWNRLGRYDEVLVYGDPSLPTTCAELNLDERISTPIRHVGYVARQLPEPKSEERPYILVTAGGGGDGHKMIRGVLDAVDQGGLAANPEMDVKIVTGPLLAKRRQAELIARVESMPNVTIESFRSDMDSLIASAAGVISMAGYNTVVELMVAGVPAILVPRTEFRFEQRVRADRISERIPHIETCLPDDCCPEMLARLVARSGQRIPVADNPLDLGGVATIAQHVTGASPVLER